MIETLMSEAPKQHTLIQLDGGRVIEATMIEVDSSSDSDSDEPEDNVNL